ncbi:MAG: sulfurtransferase TusA family protein [Promethearchaeota archaeon]
MKQKRPRSTDQKPCCTIDTRGMFCPIPVYKARQAVLEAKPRQIVELLADDPAAEEDITRWAERTGNTVLAIEKTDDYVRFLIQKTEG